MNETIHCRGCTSDGRGGHKCHPLRPECRDKDVSAVEKDLLAIVDARPGISLGELMDRSSHPTHHRSRAFVRLLNRNVLDLAGNQAVTRRMTPVQPAVIHPEPTGRLNLSADRCAVCGYEVVRTSSTPWQHARKDLDRHDPQPKGVADLPHP